MCQKSAQNFQIDVEHKLTDSNTCSKLLFDYTTEINVLKYTKCLYNSYVSNSCIYTPKYMKENQGKDKEVVNSLT